MQAPLCHLRLCTSESKKRGTSIVGKGWVGQGLAGTTFPPQAVHQ
ncbi:hypothetical protein DUNSADRAFT_17810 [Dunaliella salina]|uniref:Uncharacterized protein n=1 Tax=Dunaliella salina TaxID=3046 RepID=A0ABQ7GZS5_DUNSA|nr:hypothetical protein DUNSADRAFT_17810 [Dunaliella salina]|eukprot:KAF5840077.1 hypothetical protein DUNSADRAFT_17810 [Dunaliella salina]